MALVIVQPRSISQLREQSFGLFCFVFKKNSLFSIGKESEITQSCLTLCDPMDQAPQSMEFSRQEYGSGLPFPSPIFYWELAK